MEFKKCVEIWKSADDAFLGSGGFLNGSNLDKYIREDDEKFTKRQEIAYYVNIFASKVNRYVGYIYKKQPVRVATNALILQMFDDVDNRGNNINIFMSHFATRFKVRGVGLVLVDMAKEMPSNLKEQIDTRALPYFVEVMPYDVTEYRLDRFGKFEFIYFKDTMYIDDELVEITRYYDKTSWKVLKEDELMDSGEHNLGTCPVVYVSENGEFSSIGEFTQVARLAKRHYNLQSELDEILRYQTFPILTVQGRADDTEFKTSNGSAIFYDRDVNKPEFIAPPSAPAELYESRIQTVENQISTICYDLSTNQSKESGISLDIKFQGLNSSLSKSASSLEDFEARLFDIASKYLAVNNEVEINYPKTFSIIDINKEIEILSEMKDLVNSPTYFKQKAMQIINNDLTNIEIDVFDEISAELDDEGKEE